MTCLNERLAVIDGLENRLAFADLACPGERLERRRWGPVLASGWAVGEGRATGVGRFIRRAEDLGALQPGEILLADVTTPDWEAAMATAAGIVTNRGGADSHAAVTARRLRIPAVVGAVDGASPLWTGALLHLVCADGLVGRVRQGLLAAETWSDIAASGRDCAGPFALPGDDPDQIRSERRGQGGTASPPARNRRRRRRG